MARHRYVKGKTVETVHGDINYFSESNIVDNGQFVNHTGKQNGIFYTDENSDITVNDLVVDGYWSDSRNNKITKALLGETVRFHIETKNVPNKINLLIRVYEWNRINNIRLGSIKSVTILNNTGYFEFYLNKKYWKKLLKNTGEGYSSPRKWDSKFSWKKPIKFTICHREENSIRSLSSRLS